MNCKLHFDTVCYCFNNWNMDDLLRLLGSDVCVMLSLARVTILITVKICMSSYANEHLRNIGCVHGCGTSILFFTL